MAGGSDLEVKGLESLSPSHLLDPIDLGDPPPKRPSLLPRPYFVSVSQFADIVFLLFPILRSPSRRTTKTQRRGSSTSTMSSPCGRCSGRSTLGRSLSGSITLDRR